MKFDKELVIGIIVSFIGLWFSIAALKVGTLLYGNDAVFIWLGGFFYWIAVIPFARIVVNTFEELKEWRNNL